MKTMGFVAQRQRLKAAPTYTAIGNHKKTPVQMRFLTGYKCGEIGLSLPPNALLSDI